MGGHSVIKLAGRKIGETRGCLHKSSAYDDSRCSSSLFVRISDDSAAGAAANPKLALIEEIEEVERDDDADSPAPEGVVEAKDEKELSDGVEVEIDPLATSFASWTK